jgi:hypothetical protein
MKRLIHRFALCAILSVVSSTAFATTPQEKDFLDAYKKALESNDTKTLESFLYAKDAEPEALEYFKESLPLEEGFKLAQLELVDVTPEEAAQALKPMPGPGGTLSALPIKPSKKFIIKVESKEAGDTALTTQRAVGEVDGKLKILVPALVKK